MTASLASSTSLSPAETFYVIGYADAGPNRDPADDFDHFDISTTPARKNLSKEKIYDGWAGTTNDVSCTAHGRFDTLEAAREKVVALLGDDYREDRLSGGIDEDVVDDSVVARFRVGALPAMGVDWSRQFARETIREVGADTTDEEIEAKIAELEKSSIDDCEQKMDAAAVREAMRDRRDEKREEDAEQEDASDDGDREFDDDYAARHDAAEDAHLAAKKSYEDAAVAAGATWQEGQFHPTLGFELDAKGDIVEDGDDNAVARVEVRYPGRGKVDATVRPYDANGSHVAEFDHQFDQHLSERDIELHAIGEPVALDDARTALEAWLESDISLVAVLSGDNRDRLVWAVVPDSDDLAAAAEAVDTEVGDGDHAAYVEVRQIVMSMRGYDFYRVPTAIAETLQAGDAEIAELFGRCGSVVEETDED